MRRRPELQGLSSEHHQALVLARRAARTVDSGDDSQVERVWGEVLRRFHGELGPHFAVEERLLLPALAEAGETDLVLRTLAEHAQLRAVMARMPADTTAAPDDLRSALGRFGALLRGHARFEERVLFPAVEDRVAPEVLAEVERAAPPPVHEQPEV